jgi:hypothetical protein
LVIGVYLNFGIWDLKFPFYRMELFLEVIRKNPFIFRADYLEGYLAIGTED